MKAGKLGNVRIGGHQPGDLGEPSTGRGRLDRPRKLDQRDHGGGRVAADAVFDPLRSHLALGTGVGEVVSGREQPGDRAAEDDADGEHSDSRPQHTAGAGVGEVCGAAEHDG